MHFNNKEEIRKKLFLSAEGSENELRMPMY